MKFSLEYSGKGVLGRYFFLSVLLAAGGIVLVQAFLPPSVQIQCLFRRLSGVSCPGCGGTRCVQLILNGSFQAAFQIHPLGFVSAFVAGPLMLYSAVAEWFRLPLPWVRLERRGEKIAVVAGVLVLIIGNWVYLLCCG